MKDPNPFRERTYWYVVTGVVILIITLTVFTSLFDSLDCFECLPEPQDVVTHTHETTHTHFNCVVDCPTHENHE